MVYAQGLRKRDPFARHGIKSNIRTITTEKHVHLRNKQTVRHGTGAKGGKGGTRRGADDVEYHEEKERKL